MNTFEKNPQNPKLYKYVKPNHSFMLKALENACYSKCGAGQTGAVIVKNNKIIVCGYHATTRKPAPCPRVEKNLPTGVGYELCPHCSYDFHAEADAIRNAKNKKIDIAGADLYLWGHWWACIPCWQKMISAGIKNVYLAKGAKELFKQRDVLKNQAWYHKFKNTVRN